MSIDISKCQDGTAEQRKQNFIRFCEFYYCECIEGRKADFENMKRLLEQRLEELLEQGKISRDVKFLSRIKSPASAVEKILNKEGSYDIFGVTILTKTGEEIAAIEEALKDIQSTPRSSRNEKRGYKAVHFQFLTGENEKKTKVECHIQTGENYKGAYPHAFYKIRKKVNTSNQEERNLTPKEEEQIIQEIQRQYQSGELQGIMLSNGRRSGVPEMWETCFNEEGKMVERQLDDEEALRIAFYPCFEDLDKNPELLGGSEDGR